MIVPAVNICSSLSTPLFFLGLIMTLPFLTNLGILLFAASTVFALVTLPVEFNASSRAIAMLTAGGYVNGEEEKAVRQVLSAAALTYVAAAVTSLLSLLRLVMIANRRRD
jgi:Zn-dependent membrane protease YugP